MERQRKSRNGTYLVWTSKKVGYQGQVLPVLLASYVLATIEKKFLRKRIADAFQLLLVAPIALLLTGFLSFIVIGPITFAIGNVITNAVVGIFRGGAAFRRTYLRRTLRTACYYRDAPYVFLAVDLQLIGSTGGTFLWPMVALSNIAQGTAALAMMFVVKDEKLKSLSATSAVSAYLGITEPAMFGVNLRFRYAFISAVIGSALAGMFISLQGVKAASIGVGGLPGFLSIFFRKKNGERFFHRYGNRVSCTIRINYNPWKNCVRKKIIYASFGACHLHSLLVLLMQRSKNDTTISGQGLLVVVSCLIFRSGDRSKKCPLQ
ncbi:hypothetical protein GCM10020331_022130 [Ectobacillus funiculus]